MANPTDEVNVLITGGGGYLGYHIALALAVESIMHKSKSDSMQHSFFEVGKYSLSHTYIFIQP